MTFYNFVKSILSLTFKLIYRIEINGIENIPKDGNGIVCSNHISVLDPIIVGISIPRKVYFMAKKELFSNRLLSLLISKLGAFPVNRGEADLSAIKNALKILKENNILGMFPEGTRVKTEDIENAKPGLAMISIKGRAPIIPISIDTKYKLFGKVRIKIGEPIEFNDYYNKKLTTEDYKRLSQQIMEIIYKLK